MLCLYAMMLERAIVLVAVACTGMTALGALGSGYGAAISGDAGGGATTQSTGSGARSMVVSSQAGALSRMADAFGEGFVGGVRQTFKETTRSYATAKAKGVGAEFSPEAFSAGLGEHWERLYDAQLAGYDRLVLEAEARTPGFVGNTPGRFLSTLPEGDAVRTSFESIIGAGERWRARAGWLDLALHGAPRYVMRPDNLLPAGAAGYLAGLVGDHRGPIRLLSCSTGAECRIGSPVAQHLADMVGRPVLAPTNTLNLSRPSGEMIVGDPVPWSGFVDAPHLGIKSGNSRTRVLPNGEWKLFLPRTR